MDLVVCAFPGTGKSTAYADPEFLPTYQRMSRTNPDDPITSDRILYDSDSSNFPKEGFPQNYLDYIVACRNKADYVVQFVSTHDTVTAGLGERLVPHLIVYPRAEDKELYMARYRERGSPEPFIALMDQKWDDFMVSVRKAAEHPLACGIELKPNDYLSDVVSLFISEVSRTVEKVRNSSLYGTMNPDAPKYPLSEKHRYDWDTYRAIVRELVTKFRLTDKKIQRGTGINRVRLNKMFASHLVHIAKPEWEALLAFAERMNCFPFAPKRATPVVTTPVAVTAFPKPTESVTEGESSVTGDATTRGHGCLEVVTPPLERAMRLIVAGQSDVGVTESVPEKSAPVLSITLVDEVPTGLAAAFREVVATNSDHIPPGAYDFKIDAAAGTVTYRVPTSDIRPEDIVENVSTYFKDDKPDTTPEDSGTPQPANRTVTFTAPASPPHPSQFIGRLTPRMVNSEE